MSNSHTVVAGDTFQVISRKRYGVETNDGLLISSNPGVSEPLTVGTSIIVPNDPNIPLDSLQSVRELDEDAVTIEIDGQLFTFWVKVRLRLGTDTIDTIEVDAPFDSDVVELRELFKPFSYKSIVVYIGGIPLFTGTIVGVDPISTPTERTVTLTAYSKPGVLDDCTPAPVEFNGQNLQAIAKTLCKPFGVGVEFGFNATPGAKFKNVALSTGTSVLSFLSDLAKQRGLVINSSNRGTLRFWNSSATVTTDVKLVEGIPPLTSITPSFDHQNYFSHITGLEPVQIESSNNGSKQTVKNPHLTSLYRPHYYTIPDATDGEVVPTTEAKAARMFGNMVSYNTDVATWRDSNGDLFEVNTTVSVDAPSAMIYEPYTFLIRSVMLEATPTTRSASLELILPGAFNSTIPESLPWDV